MGEVGWRLKKEWDFARDYVRVEQRDRINYNS